MRNGTVPGPARTSQLRRTIEHIEACYEFMLAFAGAGLPPGGPEGAHGPIFETLAGLKQSLDQVPALLQTAVTGTGADHNHHADADDPDRAAWATLYEQVAQDARVAAAAVHLAVARGRIGSQLVDNLNALIHLRALLTDLFVVDELLNPTAAEPATELPGTAAPGSSASPADGNVS